MRREPTPTAMTPKDEARALVQEFSDKSRQAVVQGSSVAIPHKFKEDGSVVTDENFNSRKDISALNMSDLRFLKAWRDAHWNFESAVEALPGLSYMRAFRSYLKVKYFESEDIWTRVISTVPTPDWVAARHVDNIYSGGKLNDSELASLKELGKITGAYKITPANITANIFNLPPLPEDKRAEIKALADKLADIQEAQVA